MACLEHMFSESIRATDPFHPFPYPSLISVIAL
jgi:hypothetical protein